MHALGSRKRNPNPFALAKRSLAVEYFIVACVASDAPIMGHLADPCGRLDVETLRQGEWIVHPGLVYRREENGAHDRAA